MGEKLPLPEPPPPPPPLTKEEAEWARVVEKFFEKSPDPLHEIGEIINTAIRGRPEAIKAEYTLKKHTMFAFVILIALMLSLTTWLAVLNKLSGDTIAFIFGTAFGSIITFLYRFLSGKEA